MSVRRVIVVCGLTIAGSVAGSAAAAKGDAAAGKQEFRRTCAVCHNTDSDKRKMGPGLKALFKRDKMANGKKPSEVAVRAMIDQGGNGMPQYKDTLSAREKDDLIAYLKTL